MWCGSIEQLGSSGKDGSGSGKKGNPKEHSRYSNKDSKVSQFKRCIECGANGHFKCMAEKKSVGVKLTFTVENNLDEFFVTDNDSNIPCTDDDICSDSDTLEIEKRMAKKRENKANKKSKVKKVKHRRLSNSNLVIPTTEEDQSSESSLSEEVDYYEMRKRNGKHGSGKGSVTSKNALQCV